MMEKAIVLPRITILKQESCVSLFELQAMENTISKVLEEVSGWRKQKLARSERWHEYKNVEDSIKNLQSYVYNLIESQTEIQNKEE